MLLNDLILYKEGYLVEINEPTDKLYYKFDYDSRSYNVNMEFQHFHHFYEFFILLDQSANHIIEGELYEIQPFDIVALKSNILHKTEYPKGSPKKRLIVNFIFSEHLLGLDEDFKELLTVFNHPMPIYRFAETEQKVIFNLFNEIFTLSTSNDALKTLIIHHKFVELLYFIYNYKDRNLYKPGVISDSMTHKIYSITSFIHNNHQHELSLDFIADKFFISSYYLSHQFKKITGFTLINYIQMTRIRNAQQLLLSTNLKITAIAEQCGFTSFSQFNRVFNKLCHVSPSQFRAKPPLSMGTFS
jgi:AraC-like DNA-binding protein